MAAGLGSDPSVGLTAAEASARLSRFGPNQIIAEKPPSVLRVAVKQLRDPMNIMLIAVTAVSFAIGQVSTGVIVAALILLNVVLGSRQELKARASVDALSDLQVPQAKVVRGGGLVLVPAVEVVPGDLVQVEAGDIVPADGRIVRSATLEAQEAALTGESAPVSKDSAVLAGDVALGDRSNMLFQNTSVTRGTASMVVTGTGMDTEMGQIATMLTSVTRSRSPLQKELDTLTRVLGIIAWTAVAVIVVVGLLRGIPVSELLLLGTAMAISAIPTGLPAFVSAMLSYGAKQLAAAKAVVKNLTDVETLGATSAINTDKTGTLTMNQMMVSTIYANASWFTVEGQGYGKSGQILSVAGTAVPDFTRLALGLVLDSDATVADDGAVVGDPTEAALVVLAAKLGVDAEETRRAYPRIAEVPFDSEYKFMATFHRFPVDGVDHVIELVKGGPDVVLARCTQSGGPLSGSQVPIDAARAGIEAANARMGEKGLRVLAFAARLVDEAQTGQMAADPMSLTHDLAFVGMVGIIDPLRAEAKAAVATALHAGIDVRMITGDHAVTAAAIGETLGLGPGAVSGAELQAMSGRGAGTATAAAACVRAGLPAGQAPVGAGHAAAGADRRDDRGRGQRRGRAQAGRHRGRDGQRQRGHQTGRPDDPDRRQLRHPGARRRTRPAGLRQDRLLRAVPDDAAAVAGDAVPGRDRVQHQSGRCVDPDDGAVPAVLRDRGGGGGHHRGPRRPGRDDPATAGPEGSDHQPDRDHLLDPLRRSPFRRGADPARRRAGHPQRRPCQRIDDDDVRGDGVGHRVQRDHQPPRPDQRPDRADPAGAGDLPRPGRHDRPGDAATRFAGRAAHDLAHRPAVAGQHRARGAAAAGHRDQQMDPPP